MKIKLNEGVALTSELLAKILELQTADEARKAKLANYYKADQAINSRTMADSSKPNNKVAHPYANFITDSITGYFMGQPVKYAAKSPETEPFIAALKEIFNYNDEQSENVELTKSTCKFGTAYELLWLDASADVRFKHIDEIMSFPIYDDTLEEDILYFVRQYGDSLFDESSRTVEVYTRNEVLYYKKESQTLSFVNSVPHSWGMVPVAIYLNNVEEIGDYELTISMIDGYDKLTSDSLNDFEAFVDAYLVLQGMGGVDADDVALMKENRILTLPEGGKAEWLTKAINDTYFQNVVKTLDADIHKFSKVPDMMSESFGTNLAGIAIKYKLMGLEQKVAVKEAYFKKGLQRRIELIAAIMAIMGTSYDYRDVEILFTRNLPINELEEVSMANQLVGLVSDETVLNRLSFVDDAAKEIEKRDSLLDTEVSTIVEVPQDGTIQA